MKRKATLSLDLDDRWAYLKARGTEGWESSPSYLPYFIPHYLKVCADAWVHSTVFVVGRDAAKPELHDVLRSLAEGGHEIGNHSLNHEPWMQSAAPEVVEREIVDAEHAIQQATGKQTKGWRGPGFACSPTILSILKQRGYLFDASTFPTFLGPVARLFYLATAKPDAEQKKQLDTLYGTWSAGLRSLNPYYWQTDNGPLLELPVTTFPLFRVPIHGSYLGFIAQYSLWLARTYFKCAIFACRMTGTTPSFLLHPLDFLGSDEIKGLEFFPGMKVPGVKKRQLMSWALKHLAKYYEVMPMGVYARILLASGEATAGAGLPLKTPAKA